MKVITSLPKPIKTIRTKNINKNETYAWFPCKGKSMTDDTDRSIPDGSLILGRLIDIKSMYCYSEYLYQPVIIMGNAKGQIWSVVKTISFVDCYSYALQLRSYNKSFKDFWIPMKDITHFFVVEQLKIKKGSRWLTKQVKKGERNVKQISEQKYFNQIISK